MQTIYIDISNKGVIPTIYTKQGDIGRKFCVVFTDAGQAYQIPKGSLFSVWYDGDSGEGNYTDVGESSAFSVEGNKVTAEIISQMVGTPGSGLICLVLTKETGGQIGSWNIPYTCEEVPGLESEIATEYYTAFSSSLKKLQEVTKNLTPEAIGAAPAGYGLGGSAISVTDLNNATNCGWWVIGSDTLNRPFDYGIGMTISRYGSRHTQIAFNPVMNGCGEICVRSKGPTEWEAWEYMNPPMYLNTEYRTTERWGGKPVYVKRISFGALPASGSSNVPTGISGGTLVSLTGTFYLSGGDAEAYPVMNGSGPKCLAWVGAGCSYLYTQAIVDCSKHTGEFIIKYTKD